MTLADYPDFFQAAISDRVVRRPDRPGTRVHIYGLLEARLQNVDRLVLGGLVEGVWPPETPQRSLAQPPDAPRAWP